MASCNTVADEPEITRNNQHHKLVNESFDIEDVSLTNRS